MTRDEAEKFLPIINAYVQGKQIQYKKESGGWGNLENLHFAYKAENYRIAPDPLEQAMEIYTDSISRHVGPINVSQLIKEGLAAVFKAIKDGIIVL